MKAKKTPQREQQTPKQRADRVRNGKARYGNATGRANKVEFREPAWVHVQSDNEKNSGNARTKALHYFGHLMQTAGR